jgi:uncharacterized coiled-coil protein SlyX
MSDDTQARFSKLESHLAHLERQVEELNGVIIEQGKVIDRLRKQVNLHSQTLETSLLDQMKANNPRPPHH